MLYPTKDAYVGRSLDLYGEYGEEEVRVLLSLLREGDVVVEAGANIGADTVPIARHVGSKGFVVAFEPQRPIFQVLGANLALNGILNVLSIRAAVGSTKSTISVPLIDYSAPLNFGGVSLVHGGIGEQVNVATIDSLQLNRCSLIKADVEGMELDVLVGAAGTIERFQPRIYVENNCGPRSKELISHLISLRYRLYWHTPPLYNPNNVAGVQTNEFLGIVSCNMLCLPQNDSLVLRNFRPVSGPDDVVLLQTTPTAS